MVLRGGRARPPPSPVRGVSGTAGSRGRGARPFNKGCGDAGSGGARLPGALRIGYLTGRKTGEEMTESRVLNIGVVGLGVAAGSVIPAVANMPNMRLVAGADTSPRALEVFQERWKSL